MRLRAAIVLALVALLALPGAAFGHAELIETTPARGEQLDEPPREITFRFSESVEASFGAVQVFDGEGQRVDDGEVLRPGGRADTIGVRLNPGLGDGSYTATYRVVSADSHPISGGAVFVVGAGGGSAVTVSDLLDGSSAGPVTKAGFGIVRGVAYAAMALVLGGLLFVLVVWAPVLRRLAGASQEWSDASAAFARRARMLLGVGVLAGLVTSLLGLAFQGAIAGGTTVWAALDPNVLDEVVDTRFGTMWALRALLWIALGLIVLWPRPVVRMPALQPARLGADGTAVGTLPPPALLAAVAALAIAIAATPGLAGHAGAANPAWLVVGADTLHVLAMCAWIGLLTFLLLALPAATRRLAGPDRSRVLASALLRVSPIALASVLVLLATGIAQSIAQLESLSDFWQTGFGRAILVKAGLLVALVALGAYHRRRSIPRLRALAGAGEPPAGAGVTLRRALRAEIVLFAGVLAATSVLVASSPASAGPGVFSDRVALGPAEIEITMDPLQVGPNEIHLYFFDGQDGTALDRMSSVEVQMTQPEKAIGPLPVRVTKAGPGHYTATRADIGVTGTWEMTVNARLSEFEAAKTTFEVKIR